jgi:transcriptional regulator with XRE-family HTH domain
MDKNQQLITLRTRKLGILITDARISLNKNEEECARAMSVSPEQFKLYESGSQAPSLPELETLAYFLNVPLDYFWGNQPYSKSSEQLSVEEVANSNLFRLRNRIISTQIRLSRTQAQLTTAQISEKSGLDEEKIHKYELGQDAIPLPELELILTALNIPVQQIFDQKGPVGAWRTRQAALKEFQKLPPELQAFVCQPINRPYLELAQRLSAVDAEKLRAIAESLLEITY